MNSVATKENSVTTENGKVITQVSCDKCFSIVTKFSALDQLKEGFLSRQRFLFRDKKLKRNKGRMLRQRSFMLRHNEELKAESLS